MASSTPGDGEMPPPKRRRTESFVSTQSSPQREVGIMRKETGRGASFVGSASGIHFVRSVYSAVGQGSPEEEQASQQDLVPGEEDQLPTEASDRGREQLWRTGETARPADGRRVTFDDLVRWSQSYFDHWQPVLPFLHGPSFLDLCETIAQRPLKDMARHLNPHQLVIVRSVFSTSLMDRRQMDSSNPIPAVPQPLVFDSFHDAVTSVQAALTAAPSILSLQAAVSVQLFLISMLRHNAASRIGGIIIRLVFQMGMHRCPHRYPAFSRRDCVLRQRIFWSVYCLDRYICQSLGIPLTLRDDDVDVCLLDSEQHLSDEDKGQAMDPRLTLLCLCAKHSTIKGRVLELCNKSINHRNLDMAEVSRVRTMIAKWANDVESTLDHIPGSPASLEPLHELILNILRDESIIALNRPLLTGDRTSESYDSALQACIASSRSIIKALARHAGWTPLVWPSFTWAAWMSGFIVLYAVVEGELALSVALSLVEQCTTALDQLSARDTIWPKTCAKIVRDLAERILQAFHGPRTPMASQTEADTTNPVSAANEANTAPQQTLYTDQDIGQSGLSQDIFSSFFDQETETIDLFRGFDIPFWLGDDQYGAALNNGWA